MKKVTLKAIAEQLGLSQNSISVALRGGPGLNPETRELILRTAQEMGYTYRKKVSPLTKNILLISKASTAGDAYFFNHLFVIIQQESAALGYVLQSMNTDYIMEAFSSNGDLKKFLESSNIGGILLLGDIESDVCQILNTVHLPIVGASFFLPDIPMSCVVEDNFSGAYLLVQHLAQRGYHKVGFAGNLINVSFLERYSAFKGALTNLQLPSSTPFDLLNIDGSNSEVLPYLEHLLRTSQQLPDVYVCCNDQMAAIMLKAFSNCGLRCPQDIAVVGFDNNEISQLSTPTITSIDTSRNLQGTMSVQLLDQMITGNIQQNLRIVLPVRLQEGSSVLPAFSDKPVDSESDH